MALADMQAAGSNFYVGTLFDRGATEGEILQGLERRFPTESARSIQAAYNSGIRAVGAGDLYEAQGARGNLLLGDIPPGTATGPGVDFYVLVTYFDPVLKRNVTRPVTLPFDSIPTPDVLQAAAEFEFADVYGQPNPLFDTPPTAETATFVSLQVVAIQRGT